MKQLGYIAGACLGASILSGCGGGSALSPSMPIDHVTQMQTSARQRSSSPASFSCLTSACIYVGSSSSDGVGVNIYPARATGNVPPFELITGSYEPPNGVAVDASHNVYATQLFEEAITVYAAGAYGHVAPIQTIEGGNTGLSYPYGVAVDATGNIYVTNEGNNTVTVYAAGANGNVSPIQTISGSNTGLNTPLGLALDGAGSIYVTNCCPYSSRDGSVTVYAAGATGNASPIRTISGSNTGLFQAFGMASDRAGDIYVTDTDSSAVSEFAAGANGNVSPIRTIAGSKTQLLSPFSVALDSAGKVYVLNNNKARDVSVTVYAAHANGNVRPIRKIRGSNTELGGNGEGIAVR